MRYTLALRFTSHHKTPSRIANEARHTLPTPFNREYRRKHLQSASRQRRPPKVEWPPKRVKTRVRKGPFLGAVALGNDEKYRTSLKFGWAAKLESFPRSSYERALSRQRVEAFQSITSDRSPVPLHPRSKPDPRSGSEASSKPPTSPDRTLKSATPKKLAPGDWLCPNCGHPNFQRRTTCGRCPCKNPRKKEKLLSSSRHLKLKQPPPPKQRRFSDQEPSAFPPFVPSDPPSLEDTEPFQSAEPSPSSPFVPVDPLPLEDPESSKGVEPSAKLESKLEPKLEWRPTIGPPLKPRHPDFPHGFQVGLTFDKESVDYIEFERWRLSYSLGHSDTSARRFGSLALTGVLNTDVLNAVQAMLTALAANRSPIKIDATDPYIIEKKLRSSNPLNPSKFDPDTIGTDYEHTKRLIGLELQSEEVSELQTEIVQGLIAMDQMPSKSQSEDKSSQWKPGIVIGQCTEEALKEMKGEFSYSTRQIVANGFHIKRWEKMYLKYREDHPGWFLPFSGKWKTTIMEEDARRLRFAGRKG